MKKLRSRGYIFRILCMILVLGSCKRPSVFIQRIYQQSHAPIETDRLVHTVYLVGDAGGDTTYSKSNFIQLKRSLQASQQDKTSVVFLGDNIYPRGLHSKDHPMRKEDEARIDAQIDVVKDFNGNVVFIPGNHDWKQGKREGFDAIIRQEDYIQDRLGKVFEPSDGCSGPDDIEVSDQLTIIAIDTQWWLHQYKKGRGEKDDCNFATKEGFLMEFKELLKKNRHKHVIVVGHHPLYSNGIHGGFFSWQDHFFPLRNFNRKLWIPLPFLGSIYPLYRSSFGNIQDVSHPVYQELKRELSVAMDEYDNVIYAAGHDHNLQYIPKQNTHHVISGSGSKLTRVTYNKKVGFAAQHRGYAKIDVYKNGDVFLSYFAGDLPKGEDSLIFKTRLYRKEIKDFNHSDTLRKPSYAGKTAIVTPEPAYAASPTKRFFFGDLYRDLWTKPLEVPVLDIHNRFGGLKPIEKGGGQQTVSLKLIGGDGKEYKLRGIRKSAKFLVREDLRGTLAQDLIYDGIAGSHPYASVAVPKLAEAANIYYTKPELVVVPKDSILGDYMKEFGGMFALLEIHPDDDLSEMENFGNSSEILNYSNALEELHQHYDHVVDAPFAVRSRLLDILIGDWDRHDDQWRWATLKNGDRTIYRPIPRDRDQVFFRFDGVVMSIANRKWLIRKFQPFKEDIRDMAGLNFNARFFDRDFLRQADKTVWLDQAYYLQKQLTDSVFWAAINDLPKEGVEFNGEEIFRVLKARRAKLVDFAKRYYKILTKEVDVIGTIEEDYFEATRLENGDVEVSVYPRKDGKKVKDKRFYHRVFKYDETKEIRLYGLGDDDEYEVVGKVDKSILIRIIADEKKDRIKDYSEVKGWSKKTRVYEVEGKQKIDMGKETKLLIRPVSDKYFYNRKEFKYDQLLPLPGIGFNPDDGFLLGGGFRFTKHGFKKEPYKYTHNLMLNHTFRANGVNLYYDADYINAFGKYDLGSKLVINQPKVFQFFGLGNEVEAVNRDIGDSEIRMNNIQIQSGLSRSSDDLSRRVSLFAEYQFVELEESSFTFDNPEVQELIERNDEFFTLSINYLHESVNDKLNPSRGIRFNTNISNTWSTNTSEVEFFKIKSTLSLYFPINISKKQTSLAMRFGYSDLFGDYNFYQANFLGGLDEIRGLTRNRFAGERVAYSNIELRKSFLRVPNYIIPFDFGLIGHFDFGRLWIEGQSSNTIHRSAGGGFFLTVLDYFSVVSTFSVSDDDEVLFVGTSFYF